MLNMVTEASHIKGKIYLSHSCQKFKRVFYLRVPTYEWERKSLPHRRKSPLGKISI